MQAVVERGLMSASLSSLKLTIMPRRGLDVPDRPTVRAPVPMNWKSVANAIRACGQTTFLGQPRNCAHPDHVWGQLLVGLEARAHPDRTRGRVRVALGTRDGDGDWGLLAFLLVSGWGDGKKWRVVSASVASYS